MNDTTPRPAPTDTAAPPPFPTLDDLRRENERLAADLAVLRADSRAMLDILSSQQVELLERVAEAIRSGRAVEILPLLHKSIGGLKALQ